MDQALLNILKKNDLELIQNDGRIFVISAKPVKPTVRQLLRQYLADNVLEFKCAPKQATVIALNTLVRGLASEMHCSIQMSHKETKDRHLVIEFSCRAQPGQECDEIETYKVWDSLCEILQKDGYYNSWQLGDQIFNKVVADELAQRKPKDFPISSEDVKDVKILVNAYNTVEELLKHI